jgi:hypothetical protein
MMTLPDPVDRGLADTLRAAQGPATPLGRAFRAGLQSGVDDRLDLLRVIDGLAPASCGDFPQAVGAFLTEAPPPKGHRLIINRQVGGDGFVLSPLRGGQDNPAALRDLLGRAMGCNPTFKLGLIGRAQHEWQGEAGHFLKIPYPRHNTIYL